MRNDAIKESRPSLTEQAYQAIREMILTNRLKPGHAIDLAQLVQETKMSRTPIRDALRWIADEGLVEVRPRSGTYVARPTARDIAEVFGLRKAVEVHAIRTATHRIPEDVLRHLQSQVDEAEKSIKAGDLQFFYDSDVEFHDTILRYAENRRLTHALQTASTWLAWFRVIGTKPNRPDRSLWYHRLILQALFSRSETLAQSLLELHISEVERDMLDDFGSSADNSPREAPDHA